MSNEQPQLFLMFRDGIIWNQSILCEEQMSKILDWLDVLIFLKEFSFAHQVCIYLIKITAIWWNLRNIWKVVLKGLALFYYYLK